jgi:hypothetical protein
VTAAANLVAVRYFPFGARFPPARGPGLLGGSASAARLMGFVAEILATVSLEKRLGF